MEKWCYNEKYLEPSPPSPVYRSFRADKGFHCAVEMPLPVLEASCDILPPPAAAQLHDANEEERGPQNGAEAAEAVLLQKDTKKSSTGKVLITSGDALFATIVGTIFITSATLTVWSAL